jgi:hypothetical protein
MACRCRDLILRRGMGVHAETLRENQLPVQALGTHGDRVAAVGDSWAPAVAATPHEGRDPSIGARDEVADPN